MNCHHSDIITPAAGKDPYLVRSTKKQKLKDSLDKRKVSGAVGLYQLAIISL